MLPLSYSTNLHRAESSADLLTEVVPFAGLLRRDLGWDRLGLDLRLGFAALDLDPGVFRRSCEAQGLVVHTLNGFPLEPFQAPVVKEGAYRPDWTDLRRVTATRRLMEILLALSDEHLLTISTVPGSFAPWRADPAQIAAHLLTLAAEARAIEDRTGRRIILALEPEPWCSLETTWDAVAFWQRWILPTGLGRWLGLCFDTCHASLAFEDPAEAVARLVAAGIPIPKAQVSAAPEARNAAGLAALARLAEPRFLHQTAARSSAGSVARQVDLTDLPALTARLPGWTAIRSHFHIPLHAHLPDLASTADESRIAVAALRAAGCTHLGVETYTWPLLSPDGAAIRAGTAAELRELAAWCHDGLQRPS